MKTFNQNMIFPHFVMLICVENTIEIEAHD